jgi:hypothetical protein
MHTFLIGHYYRSPIGDIVRCIGCSTTEAVWQTKDLLFYVSSYREGMKYSYLPDCDGFEEEKFPQWYILDGDYPKGFNPWALERTSCDVVTRYELKDNVLTHEEQDWYQAASCWKLVTEKEALGAVAPAYPKYYLNKDKDSWGNTSYVRQDGQYQFSRYNKYGSLIDLGWKDYNCEHAIIKEYWIQVSKEEALKNIQHKGVKRIRTNLWFDKDDGVVIQANLMPDDRFIQLKFDAEGVYYEGSCETMV